MAWWRDKLLAVCCGAFLGTLLLVCFAAGAIRRSSMPNLVEEPHSWNQHDEPVEQACMMVFPDRCTTLLVFAKNATLVRLNR